ncbi:MAG: PQQ-like beta-propeller repeat protein, partial [Planctomycetales bacterium]|nr:PQQ-like beta-propeller repeat protein [Planctomycetales bacterium]
MLTKRKAHATKTRLGIYAATAVWLCASAPLTAQDWPQWRGPDRDGRVVGFEAPATWPNELTRQWQVTVGDGVATPALVGDRIYVAGRENDEEVTRCLNADTGEEIWKDHYAAEAVRGPAQSFGGPRSSLSVADGKVVLIGVQGVVSCYDTAEGKALWRNTAHEGTVPRFAASSSPLLMDGLCIAELGSDDQGGVFVFDLSSGEKKWEWTGDGACYGSPISATVGDWQVVIAPTASKLVILRLSDGKLLFEMPYRQGRYNAATPLVVNDTLILAGPERGITARKLSASGDAIAAEEVWANTDHSVQYNTPVAKEGALFGLSNLNSLFCIDMATGKTLWSVPVGETQNAGVFRSPNVFAQQRQREGGRGRRGGRGSGGYGSVVNAGSVLMALTPAMELVVYAPSTEEFTELAKYKIADRPTYAYPILSGNRVFVKDQE